MEGQRILNIEGLGQVVFRKRRRVRRITIRVRSYSDIRVTLPIYVSYLKAEDFVKEKSDWIRASKLRMLKNLGERTVFHELTEFSTLHHQLFIERVEGDSVKSRIRDGKILISVPFHMEVLSDQVQTIIRSAILETWRKEAKEILPARVEILAKKFGFSYKNIQVRNMSTRWGSCSGDNRIHLNLHLIRIPEYLCDYVILHELVHTVHKNHGSYFWQQLEKVCESSKQKAKEMRLLRLDLW